MAKNTSGIRNGLEVTVYLCLLWENILEKQEKATKEASVGVGRWD